MTDFLIGVLVTLLIVALALRQGYLARSGGLAALFVGSAIFGLGGWRWGVLLGLFFFSSSLLSRYKAREKQLAAEKFSKGHTRDWGQVLANGGLAALYAVAGAIWPAPLWALLFTGALAAVNADTWATELGTLSRRPPRLITTGRIADVGTSGAITPFGTLVSAAGGGLIGLAAGLLLTELTPLAGLLFGAGGGLAGSLLDSLLGATVQRIYYDDLRQKETERTHRADGQPTRPLRGWSWMNNDVVNLFAAISGGLTVWLLASLI
ncbi:MAG: DUF92 domain-containing protein [Ardenticatenales bacterium]|nr:DUF92 domain-containing protein [Ardenticatenales bacterium]